MVDLICDLKSAIGLISLIIKAYCLKHLSELSIG
jgi:hypothetical protein